MNERMFDRLTVLLSAGMITTAVIGSSCSTNARIDDANARTGRVEAAVQGLQRTTQTSLDAVEAQLRAIALCLAGTAPRPGPGDDASIVEPYTNLGSRACEEALRLAIGGARPTTGN